MRVSGLLGGSPGMGSSIDEVARVGEMIVKASSAALLIRSILFWLVAAVVLVGYFGLPVRVVALIVGAELIVVMVGGYLRIRQMNAFVTLGSQDDPRMFRRLIVAADYWGLVRSIFGVVVWIGSAALLFTLFPSQLSGFAARNLPIQVLGHEDWLVYVIASFVVFRVFDLAVRWVRYVMVKGLPQSMDVESVKRDYALIVRKQDLVKFVPGMSFLLLVLFWFGIPSWILLMMVAFMVLMVVLSVRELRLLRVVRPGQ
ncbi:MAG: hypothetical protein ABIH41_06500 [Nanoarchaeota archaeon]